MEISPDAPFSHVIAIDPLRMQVMDCFVERMGTLSYDYLFGEFARNRFSRTLALYCIHTRI